MKKQMIQLSMDDFCAEVKNTMNSLPSFFYEHLDNLVVEVEDYPSRKTLKKAHFTDAEIKEGSIVAPRAIEDEAVIVPPT